MNKLPTKQIYLLMIIVFGIITLSIYSTYSIFTLESESSDIVSIHTPSNLSILLDSYEYQQVNVPANSYITTDIDIYNNFNYDICYSIWYTIATKNIDSSRIKIYENTNESITTSSTLSSVSNRRINLIIINDNNQDVKVNIGLANAENKETCELNIESDKLIITNTIDNPKVLTDNVINNTQPTNNEEGYLTYKDIEEDIILSNEKLYVSKEFTYKDELFTLTDPEEITIDKILDYKNYYTCLDSNECNLLYNIIDITREEDSYKITKYNILSGYLSGDIGLRKINNDYYFYGDNPNNFIYFNCANELDTNTCELWRIIGFIYDTEENKYLTKIIKEDYLLNDKYSDNNQEWDKSSINKYFTDEYKLNDNYLKEISFKQENITDLTTKTNDIKLYNNNIKSNITLMNLSDYLNASICENREIKNYNDECLKNNWLNKNNQINEWTTSIKYIEPYKDKTTEEIITPDNNTIYSVGNTIEDNAVSSKLNIRPVVYLKSRMFLTSGDGSFENPYVIR